MALRDDLMMTPSWL